MGTATGLLRLEEIARICRVTARHTRVAPNKIRPEMSFIGDLGIDSLPGRRELRRSAGRICRTSPGGAVCSPITIVQSHHVKPDPFLIDVEHDGPPRRTRGRCLGFRCVGDAAAVK